MSDEEIEESYELNRCPACGEIRARSTLVECSKCHKWYHLSCIRMRQVQARVIERWVCTPCRNVSGSIQILPANGTPAHSQIGGLDGLTDLIIKCRKNLQVLKIIPKGARITAAEALCTLLEDVTGQKSVTAWSKLLLFPYLALYQPKNSKSKRGSEPSLTTKVKNQITAYVQSPFPPTELPQISNVQRKERSQEVILKTRVAAKFIDNDLKGAIRELSSDDKLAPYCEETIAKLKERHPAAPSDVVIPQAPDDIAPIIIDKEAVKKAILSFPAGSAGGPDGIRPNHLKHLISLDTAEAGARLLLVITRFTLLVIAGDIPDEIKPIFFGANLCALLKKDGGVRPIAVGITWRRLATKLALKPISTELGAHLRPKQLGFSSKGGSEAAAHSARQYLNGNLQNRVFLKLDIKNAFNCINRNIFLNKVKENFPSFYPLAHAAYSGHSNLFYGERIIHSVTGLQQGDPCGPALFALGLDEIIKNIKAEFNVWYLDDSNIADCPEVVMQDVTYLIRELQKIGLSINSTKSELTLINAVNSGEVINAFRGLLPNIKIVSVGDSCILGSPVSSEGVKRELIAKREALERMVTRLELIDTHQALILLRHSFSIPKLIYLLRSSPAYKELYELRSFDETLKEAVSKITNISFSEEAWLQASLPIKAGGLGMRKSEDIALPCFISSTLSVRSLIHAILLPVPGLASVSVAEEIEIWKNMGNLIEPEGDAFVKQRAWDAPLIDIKQKYLLDNSNDQFDKARLLAANQHESGAWLTAIPVPSLGTQLCPEEIRIAICLRLGVKICEPHFCRCHKYENGYGYHLLSCRFNEGRHPRHAAINDIICRALKISGLPSVLEPVGLDRGDGKRPDGISIFPFCRGKCLCWDATCINTFSESAILSSATKAGTAAHLAEEAKIRKYPSLVTRFQFEPIAVETTGVYGTTTKKIIAEIGRRIKEKTGEPRELMWLKQRLSMAIQRGNCLTISSSARQFLSIDLPALV